VILEPYAFGALTPLIGQFEGNLAHKTECWYLGGVISGFDWIFACLKVPVIQPFIRQTFSGVLSSFQDRLSGISATNSSDQ